MNDRTTPRSKSAKIARLRERVQRMAQDDPRSIVVAGVILGLLDLLDDEL